MGKIIAKIITALIIGITIGLFTGYVINSKKYFIDGKEVSKYELERNLKFETNGMVGSDVNKYKRDVIEQSTKTVFNQEVGLLCGSAITSIVIVLLLYSELKEKK